MDLRRDILSRRCQRALLRALLVLSCLFSWSMQAGNSEDTMVLQVGETRLFPITEKVRVIVGNPRVIQAVHDLKQTELVITAMAPGFSSLQIAGQVFAVTVHNSDNLRSRWTSAQDLLGSVSGVQVTTRGDKLVIDGLVQTTGDLERVKQVAEAFSAINLARIDPMAVLHTPMVRLVFRFAEVRRDWERSLGIRWENGVFATVINGLTAATSNLPGGLLTPASSGTTQVLEAAAARMSAGGVIATSLDSMLSMSEENNLYHVRDTHTITLVSGREGHYLAGGSILIPVSNGLGQATLQEKEFGVRARVVPTLLDSERMQLDLDYEISSLLSAHNGTYTLSKRSQTTLVTLKMGEMLVLAGNVSHPDGRSFRGIPWLTDIPILGPLFGSHAWQEGKTDAVIFVTPTLVPSDPRVDREKVDQVLGLRGSGEQTRQESPERSAKESRRAGSGVARARREVSAEDDEGGER